jgi:mycobactin salicyl-AMP ligase
MTGATMRNNLDAPTAGMPARSQVRLDSLMAGRAASHPADVLVADLGARLTYADAEKHVARLGALLASLDLAAASSVALVLPNGREALLSALACQRAGLRPCLMSPALNRAELTGAIAAVGAEVVITATHVGELKPAEMLCEVAASFFGLRFLCAFGVDVPDGVVPLDPALKDGVADAALRQGHSSVATLDKVGDHLAPVWRETEALVAAALPLLLAARIAPSDRLISLMAPDTLAGLATGFAAALASGAALSTHAMFDSEALLSDIAEGPQAHLVAPAWIEPLLRQAGLMRRLKSLILVHRPPASLMATPAAPLPIIDAVALGETALLVGARDAKGLPSISVGTAPPAAMSMTEIRLDRSDAIEVRGRAVAGTPLGALARSAAGEASGDGWVRTRFFAEYTGPRLTAVKEIAPAAAIEATQPSSARRS